MDYKYPVEALKKFTDDTVLATANPNAPATPQYVATALIADKLRMKLHEVPTEVNSDIINIAGIPFGGFNADRSEAITTMLTGVLSGSIDYLAATMAHASGPNAAGEAMSAMLSIVTDVLTTEYAAAVKRRAAAFQQFAEMASSLGAEVDLESADDNGAMIAPRGTRLN